MILKLLSINSIYEYIFIKCKKVIWVVNIKIIKYIGG